MAEENIARLEDHRREEKTPVVNVPAMGISVVSNFPGERGITVQCHIGSDESLEAQNALTDRMFAIIDRQKARYELPAVLDELEVHEKTLARMEEDGKAVVHSHRVAQARRNAEVKALERELENEEKLWRKNRRKQLAEMQFELGQVEAKRQAEFDTGYQAFAASGREGSYTPDGHRAINLSRMDGDIAKRKEAIAEFMAGEAQALGVDTAPVFKRIEDKKAEISKEESERLQHESQLEISRKRYTEEILIRQNKIRKLRAILAGKEPAEG